MHEAELSHKNSHRFIIEYYRGKLPSKSKTRIYPFTIKKGSNVYGLVFGSKNVLGVEKFLRVAWDKNKLNGEANFDIDGDVGKQQGVLFEDMKQHTKLEQFHVDVKELFATSKSLTNKDLYDFALSQGFLPTHAAEAVKALKKEDVIEYNGHARISYDKCYKNRDIVQFRLKSK